MDKFIERKTRIDKKLALGNYKTTNMVILSPGIVA